MAEESTTLDPNDWIAQHVRLYLEDPEKAHLWDFTPVGGPGKLPTLLLTTIGRKSGEPRHLPLLYEKTNGGYIIEDIHTSFLDLYSGFGVDETGENSTFTMITNFIIAGGKRRSRS